MKSMFSFIILGMITVNIFFYEEYEKQQKTIDNLKREIYYYTQIDCLNLNIPLKIKSVVNQDEYKKSLRIIVPPEICYACLENELSVIKKRFRNNIPLIFIVKFNQSKNIQVLNNRNNFTNYTILKDENIIEYFSNFHVPIIIYNGFLFFPMKNNIAFSSSFYSKIPPNQ